MTDENIHRASKGAPTWMRVQALRRAFPFALAAVCLWLVSNQCEDVQLTQVWAAVSALPPQAWGLATLATCISFWAIGRYDVVMHRHFDTGQSAQSAAMAGRAATAIGQVVGFGLLTGAVVRWRWFEPRMSPWDSARLTLAVTAMFLMSLGVITLTALAIVPIFPGGIFWGAAALAAVLALGALSLFQPGYGRFKLPWPSLLAMARLVGFAAIDTACAAAALWLLMPSGADLGFALVLTAYLLALGAALITGTPGGLGPFEVTLLAVLPQMAETEVLAAILGFRLIYYALPASLAGGALIWRHLNPMPASPPRHDCCAKEAIANHRHAELNLLHHPKKTVIWDKRHNAGWLCEQTDQALVGFFDPIGAAPAAARIAQVQSAAQACDRVPFLYKTNARSAAAARRAGWFVASITEDAVLNPLSFDLSSRGCRQARRKMRKAAKAGIKTQRAGIDLPIKDMAEINRAWSAAAGGERGFSMNRFATALLKEQAVFLAYAENRLAGFVSFHTTDVGWALDLVRPHPEAPDGTMHALVLEALYAARAEGISYVSLASVPVEPASETGLAACVQRRIVVESGGAGLRQFKASFGPRWQRRYIAAPTRLAFCLGAWDVVRSVRPANARHTDRPIRPEKVRSASLHNPHDNHENYEIA